MANPAGIMSLMASSMTTAVSPEAIARYEPVIGLEVHVQLATRTKIFCGCPTSFGAPPNTNVCPVCLGLPGALPVLSRHAVELAIEAVAGAELPRQSALDFRPQELLLSGSAQGLPDLAIRSAAGRARLRRYRGRTASHKRIGITRVHMEDDAGKSIHDGFKDSDRYTYVDLNRSGTPLIEIVSEPDIRSADEAHAYLTEIKQVLQYVRGIQLRHGKRPSALRRQRQRAPEGRGKVRHQGRGQESELVPVSEAGRGSGDRAAGGNPRKRRPRDAGNSPVQSGYRRDREHAQQGTRARLSLFSRARSGAAAGQRSVAGRVSAARCRSFPRRGARALSNPSGCASTTRRY